MGTVVRLDKRQRKRDWRQVQAEDSSQRESRQALWVLILAFTITAIVMSAVVVVETSSTWAGVLLMTVVVLVFALLKIGLADAAFWVMLRADDETEKAMAAKAAEEKDALPTEQPPTRDAPRATRPLSPSRKRAARPLTVPGKPLQHPPASPSG